MRRFKPHFSTDGTVEVDDYTRYSLQRDDPKSLGSNHVWSILEDSAGVIWIGAEGDGLNKFDAKNNAFTRYLHRRDDPASLSQNTVLAIFEDNEQVLWIGTNGGGLNRFDKVEKTFSRFTEKDGLPNNVIYSIIPDNSAKLWLSTNKGLAKFDPAAQTFKNYDMDNDPAE